MIQAELYAVQDGAASFVTVPFQLLDLNNFSVFVYFPGGGTLSGTLTLEAGADNVDAKFITITDSSQTVTNSAQHTWSAARQGYKWVRCRWVYSAGAGDVQVIIQVKENVIKGA